MHGHEKPNPVLDTVQSLRTASAAQKSGRIPLKTHSAAPFIAGCA
jgi:hypothetical protein